MKLAVYYKQLFAYSEATNKYFYTSFDAGINIVYGKNTSGKSTLIQSILYTFGINDEKPKLKEILDEGVLFRLDIELNNKTTRTKEAITIIRDNEVVIVRRMAEPVRKFIGISGNNSVEHFELKNYWANIFEFNLHLESSGEYKQAPLEAFFLPFYVAQDVGWVYRHKSFRGLDFIKNFKNDFFDYYLGISNDYDRERKAQLELKKKEVETQIRLLTESRNGDTELKISMMLDEKCVTQTNEYLEDYKEKKAELIELEKDYLLQSNHLTYLDIRKNFLSQIKREIVKQSPLTCKCPTCNQTLPSSPEIIYRYYQDLNDTKKQLDEIRELSKQLKDKNGNFNTTKNKIERLQKDILANYDLYNKYSVEDLSLGTWLSNKVNVKLVESVTQKIGQLTVDLNSLKTEMQEFATEDVVNKQRDQKSRRFADCFKRNLQQLGVKPFDDDRYTTIYKIPAFPKQGVELLKTLLAYNFAFGEIIQETNYVHNIPLLLDAIFKEDIDEENRKAIIKFLKDNVRHQIIVSIADSQTNLVSAECYNNEFLGGKAKMICIGENKSERSFLKPYNGEHPELLKETQEIVESDV